MYNDSMSKHVTKGTEQVDADEIIAKIKREFKANQFMFIAGAVMDRIDKFVNPTAFKGVLQFNVVDGLPYEAILIEDQNPGSKQEPITYFRDGNDWSAR